MKIERSTFESTTTTDTCRDEMLRQNMGLVHSAVERVCGAVARASGSFDDLVSAGMMGLVNAYDGFDESRGVAFSTYAHPRVRGAILDELRKQDNAPRSVRRKNRAVAKARDAASARANGRVSEKAVAAELGVDVATLQSWELDGQMGSVDSIDAGTTQESAAALSGCESWQAPELTADVVMERQEEVDGVREALARMPQQERIVLILYFYEDLKLKQIGEVIGVSESRVSQIRGAALARLRREMSTVAA